MAARIVEAGSDQPLHAEMAHVAERHRLTGGLNQNINLPRDILYTEQVAI
jgi:hypothetical protein